MQVVAVMAHQDDEMRCLGTMLKCRERGDQLAFITLTDGCRGFVQAPEMERAEAARIRHDEMRVLADAVGATYLSVGEEDEFLYDTPAVRWKLVEALRAAKAEVVFTHYHEDYNQDHIATNQLVRHCVMQAALPVMATKSAPLAAVPAVFCVPPHGASSFLPSHFVDISAYEERKVTLLKLHKSQEEALTRAVGAGFDALCARPDAYWGEQAGCAFAECFAPLRSRGTIKPYSVLP